MANVPAVYDLPESGTIDCRVAGRMVLPQATVELHRYRFTGPQQRVFRSGQGFLDLALSRRPGEPQGVYTSAPRRAPVPMGDIIFIPAEQALETCWGEGEQLSVCCGFAALAGDDALAIDGEALMASLDVRSMAVRDALVRLAREIERPGFGSSLLCEALLAVAGIELQRYFRGPMAERPGAARLSAAQLRRVEDAVEAPGALPTVAALAALCGLSQRHFFRLFRASTGQTLAAFAAERRMARACALLAEPRRPIKDIAWRCGFETPAAFSAAFRKMQGVTPSAFRDAHRT